MNHDVQGLVAHIGLGGVPDAFVLAGLAPGVLDHIVFVAELVAGDAVDLHSVVVGDFLAVEAFLTGFLSGDFLLGSGDFLHAFFLAYPALLVGTCGLHGLHVHQHCKTVAGEAGIGHIGAPGDGVAVIEGGVDDVHQFVDGEVPGLVPAPVVADFDCEFGVERMMGVRTEGDVVLRVDLHGVAIALCGVGFAVHLELIGDFAKIGIQDAVETLLPGSGETVAVGNLGNCAHICLEHCIHLRLFGQFGAVVHSGVCALGNYAVVAYDGEHVVCRAAGREVEVAVQTHVFVGPVGVGLIYAEHLREVGILEGVFDVAQTYGLGLEETYCGEGPAGAAAILVLDGSDGVLLDNGEFVFGELYLGFGLRCCTHAEKRERSEYKDAFHIRKQTFVSLTNIVIFVLTLQR